MAKTLSPRATRPSSMADLVKQLKRLRKYGIMLVVGDEAEIVERADTLEDAEALVSGFMDLGAKDPTGGKLFIVTPARLIAKAAEPDKQPGMTKLYRAVMCKNGKPVEALGEYAHPFPRTKELADIFNAGCRGTEYTAKVEYVGTVTALTGVTVEGGAN